MKRKILGKKERKRIERKAKRKKEIEKSDFCVL
jgi:hypothetical protein